jgi:inner membrane protein
VRGHVPDCSAKPAVAAAIAAAFVSPQSASINLLAAIVSSQPCGVLAAEESAMRTSVLARLIVMGFLLVGLLLPLSMIGSVVSERASRRGSVVDEISSTWGGVQTLGGPVLMVPYCYSWTASDGTTKQGVAQAFFLPESLDIKGALEPQRLQRGLFEVVVYKAHLSVTGRFARPDFSAIRPGPAQPVWEDATISMGVTDPRGIARRMVIKWNGADVALTPGLETAGLFASGLHAAAGGLSTMAASASIPFALELDVNGTRDMKVLPAGGETTVQLTSTWPHPSFIGAPLPAFREAGAAGFIGRWNVPYVGRGLPLSWTSVGLDTAGLRTRAESFAIGVSLLQPVDIYQQAERAVKYASLFIVMTFVIFFMWEVVRSRLVHPIQYLFVGFAMCVFYLLLVSISEHIGFDRAYAIAASATTALIAGYSICVLGGLMEGGLMGLALAVMYGFLYLLLRLEDYALLGGSIALFVMLTLLMYATRRINWYEPQSAPTKV